MLTPSEPTALGVFIPYPANASGSVSSYWLMAGGSTLYRMTAACRRAVMATIEAAIERSIVPAPAGNTPPANYNFKTNQLGSSGALVAIGKWQTVADRDGMAARFVRGCPFEDWDALIRMVAALWHGASYANFAGTVMAWQLDSWKWHTAGFVESIIPEEGDLISPLWDLSSLFADETAFGGETPVLRPWGDYPGGGGGAPVSDWVSDTLIALGVPEAEADTSGTTPGTYAEYAFNGSPSPLDTLRGHLQNWFGSSSNAMVGSPSLRRSSSGWAVLQSMLAQMAFTHLLFGYAYTFTATRTVWAIRRWFTMDEDWNIVVEEDLNYVTTEDAGSSTTAYISTWEEYQSGASSIDFSFECNNVNVAELAELVRPPDDGWKQVGLRVAPFLTPTYIEDDAVLRTLTRAKTDGLSEVEAANGNQYPAPAFESYCEHKGVTFIDKATHYTGNGMNYDWTKWSVKQEAGSKTLTTPVRQHGEWLLQQLPNISFPQVAAVNAAAVRRYSDAWWASWELKYPEQPNVTVDGDPAYFPVAIRNLAAGAGAVAITYDFPAWSSGAIRCLYGMTELAFPDYGTNPWGGESYNYDHTGEALAAHEWHFKAMPTS